MGFTHLQMSIIHFVLVVVFVLLSCSFFCSTSPVEIDDEIWPWTKVKYLTRTNWTSSLMPDLNSTKQHRSVWFIFHYLNYCGVCKKAEPGWEAAGRYAVAWSKYIKIGAYDCASESLSQNDICPDENYPQWRIFCPLTNSTELAFDSSRRSASTTSEELLIWSLKRINKIAHTCYGKGWPVRHVLELKSADDLNKTIPKHVKKFQLFISNDLLHYTLYVLNNSKTVQFEPIYRLPEQNPIAPHVGILKGQRQANGSLSLEQINLKTAMQPFVLEKHLLDDTKSSSEKKKQIALEPTSSDFDSAVVWMLTRDIRRKLPRLTEDVKAWLKILHKYYPGSDTMKTFLNNLIDFMNNQTTTTVTPAALQIYINSTSTIKLPEIKFDHCQGSDPSKRGYPCSLWVLFHGMTVKQAILAEKNQLSIDVKPSDIVVAIREFIRKFFLCEECAQHFVNMTANAENEIDSHTESVLYLWRGHNKVNQRLRSEPTSTDPGWPKVPFPTKQQCNACVQEIDENGDAIKFNDEETYKYFKDFYTLQSDVVVSTKAAADRPGYSLRSLLVVMLVCFFLIK